MSDDLSGGTFLADGGYLIHTYYWPPFLRSGGTDPDRSLQLRRYLFDTVLGSFAWVDDRGRLMRGVNVKEQLVRAGLDVESSLEFIRNNHLVKIVPFGYEGAKFWRRDGVSGDAMVCADENLSYML